MLNDLQCVHNLELRKVVVDAILNGGEGDTHSNTHSLDIELLDVSIDG